MNFQRTKRATVAALALSAGLGIALPAIGASTASAASKVTLFMLPKFTGIPPFTQADQGGAAQAKQYGYTLKYGGPTTASATDQVNFINDAVAAGDKGIFISADNPAAVTPALQRAEAHGVKVVSFDSDVLPAGRTVYVQGTSAVSIAMTELNMLGSQIGYSGSFVILSAQATDTNQVQWNSLVKADLSLPKYKNMKLVTIVNPPDDSAASATKYMQSILQEYPTIKGVIAPTTVAVAAAAQVLQQQKLCSKYVLTGLGDPSQMKTYVTSGCVKQFALWNFSTEGTVAMCAMHAVLTGSVSGKTGQSFTCGSRGKFVVAAGGVVTAGPAEVFSKANLQDFTF
jgi:rhamnose transport system substrate-binding protein